MVEIPYLGNEFTLGDVQVGATDTTHLDLDLKRLSSVRCPANSVDPFVPERRSRRFQARDLHDLVKIGL